MIFIGTKHLFLLFGFFFNKGDTLYATDGELIDWYVGGSSVNQMAQSVRRLSDLMLSEKVTFFILIYLLTVVCPLES